ncbi:MAG: SMC-Scp complex subunit ScpB [Planctomycetota bacterium]
MNEFKDQDDQRAESGGELGAEGVFSDELLPGAVEAVLLAGDKPLSAARIAQAVGLDEDGSKRVKDAVGALNTVYEETGRSFRIETVAGGMRVMTLPEYATAVAAIRGMRDAGRLSKAAVETLAIIAYRQPVTRAELEGIRGVACGEVVRTLLDRRLVEITGRAEEIGRPMLYGTTKRFLELFGLASLKELPPVEEFDPAAAIRSLAEEEPVGSDDREQPSETAREDEPATA